MVVLNSELVINAVVVHVCELGLCTKCQKNKHTIQKVDFFHNALGFTFEGKGCENRCGSISLIPMIFLHEKSPQLLISVKSATTHFRWFPRPFALSKVAACAVSSWSPNHPHEMIYCEEFHFALGRGTANTDEEQGI